MNRKAVYAACLFAALNVCTLAARAEAADNVRNYTYGTQLDIKKVLSTSQDATPTCAVVNARLTYLDSHEQTQVLNYRTLGDHCIGEN
ncbi:TPA: DUF2790 domain-containing protein [Pseudomonas putida]|uniref:DUF2790 domain-containing protein n=1 Tax=Pseudomonas TaxID=286 RepID=UPI0004827300|nr:MULTISPECIES: DUF2790 domain-containing protein [Pseudomonas]MDD2152512.1 DUF2790 domain-containing protein [Pseudomonas putida]RAS21475.1 uncharacterized protein DUF2790 [Pseudomonas sp. URMO17WK12:I7]SMF68737.1 Protein of unknown function [Pseudomonas sp. URMO17WK12:I5]HDS1679262.1 DUF2790 domain-containing protein [Pseudomonas putida]